MSFRIPLAQRVLPNYSVKEEWLNTVSHGFGAFCGIVIFAFALSEVIPKGNTADFVGVLIYGVSLVTLYTVSAVYHGLKLGYSKKVMQVIDHCTIYFLIAGTYTPVLLTGFFPRFSSPGIWGMVIEWSCALFAAALTAVDLKRSEKFSMFCYIVMGWLIIVMLKPALAVLTVKGFLWLLGGGIAYTVGAVLYGIGKRKPFFHFIFHIFTVIGSILQAVCILVYVL